ncbi:MAG: regulatory protein RecX [Bacteroidota bacterium]|nr:regulatory protein RecX [Bacteroidota bacterium]
MPGVKHMEYKVALQRAAALCSSQEQCSSHIRTKLNQWKVSDPDADKIIELLKKEKFLDDARYATFYVRDKYRFNGWGKIKLAVMLRQKEIPSPYIEEALSQIDPEHYKQTCERLISEKSATLKESNQFKRKGKLFRYAAQRGFESDLIHQILSYL